MFAFLRYNSGSKRGFLFSDLEKDGCGLVLETHSFADQRNFGAKLIVPSTLFQADPKEHNPYLDFTPLARVLRDVLEDYLFIEISGINKMPFEGNFTIRPEFAVDIPVQHLHKDRAHGELIFNVAIGFHVAKARRNFMTLLVPDVFWDQLPDAVRNLSSKDSLECKRSTMRESQAEIIQNGYGMGINKTDNTLTLVSDSLCRHGRVLMDPGGVISTEGNRGLVEHYHMSFPLE